MAAVIRLVQGDDGRWYCHVTRSDVHHHDSYDEALAHIRDLAASCPGAAVFVPARAKVRAVAG
jgi:hypothetical protein